MKLDNKRFTNKGSKTGFPLILYILGILLIIVGLIRLITLNPANSGIILDFNTYYQSAKQLIAGQSIYSIGFKHNQTPLTAILFIPLTYLSYENSATVWTVLTIIAYICMGIIILRVQNIKISFHWNFLLLGIALTWYPFLIHISMGQINILISLIIIMSWAFLRRKQEFMGGFLLGLACALKIFPGIFILFLVLRKRWTATIVMIGTIIAGFIISALVIGPKEVMYYFTNVISQDSKEWFAYPLNLSPTSTIYMIFTDNRWVYPVMNARFLASITMLLLDIGLAVYLLYKLITLPKSILGDDLAYGFCIISMLLIAPLTWQHIFPILLLPLSILFKSYLDQQNVHHRNQALLSFLFLSIPGGEIVLFVTEMTRLPKIPWYLALPIQLPLLGVFILMISLMNYKPFSSPKTRNDPIVDTHP